MGKELFLLSNFLFYFSVTSLRTGAPCQQREPRPGQPLLRAQQIHVDSSLLHEFHSSDSRRRSRPSGQTRGGRGSTKSLRAATLRDSLHDRKPPKLQIRKKGGEGRGREGTVCAHITAPQEWLSAAIPWHSQPSLLPLPALLHSSYFGKLQEGLS